MVWISTPKSSTLSQLLETILKILDFCSLETKKEFAYLFNVFLCKFSNFTVFHFADKFVERMRNSAEFTKFYKIYMKINAFVVQLQNTL